MCVLISFFFSIFFFRVVWLLFDTLPLNNLMFILSSLFYARGTSASYRISTLGNFIIVLFQSITVLLSISCSVSFSIRVHFSSNPALHFFFDIVGPSILQAMPVFWDKLWLRSWQTTNFEFLLKFQKNYSCSNILYI
jgi:hypothetical protein